MHLAEIRPAAYRGPRIVSSEAPALPKSSFSRAVLSRASPVYLAGASRHCGARLEPACSMHRGIYDRADCGLDFEQEFGASEVQSGWRKVGTGFRLRVGEVGTKFARAPHLDCFRESPGPLAVGALTVREEAHSEEDNLVRQSRSFCSS